MWTSRRLYQIGKKKKKGKGGDSGTGLLKESMGLCLEHSEGLGVGLKMSQQM